MDLAKTKETPPVRASEFDRDDLMHRARKWVLRNQCPLPIDLVIEMGLAGLDVDTIETELLEENNDGA